MIPVKNKERLMELSKETPDNMVRLYVIENAPQGYVKIGQTNDPKQRMTSLSGSNGGGNHIVKCAMSEPTRLRNSLEHVAHIHFEEHRITGTEWFEIPFLDAVTYIDNLFASPDFSYCEKIRETYGSALNLSYAAKFHRTKETLKEF